MAKPLVISQTGADLARIKELTGLTWGALGDTIGSTGEYVRQVARGAKPGNNLSAVVSELLSTGQVSKAVPRRRTAAGTVAKVRASAATGEKSRRPGENAVRAGGNRRLFQSGNGRLGWTQSAGTPSEGGRGTLSSILTSAGRGQKRVKLRVEVRPYGGGTPRWVDVGSKGGYRPRDIAAGIRKAGSEEAWLQKQLAGRPYANGHVLDVEVSAE